MRMLTSTLARTQPAQLNITAYFTPEFRNLIEDHLTILIKGASPQAVSDLASTRYANNFYGLLRELKIEYRYFWTYLRVNGLHNPADYTGEDNFILIPNLEVLGNLDKTHRTVKQDIF